jgi:hypothetical protein
MRLAIFCVAVIVSVVLCPRAYSLQEVNDDYYFDFSLPQNVLRDGQEVAVQFSWNITDFEMVGQKRLTVKPFISAGAVEIYNADLAAFVGVADLNSELPYLQKEMRLRFSGVQNLETPAVLHFSIYDTLAGQKYETPDKKIWGTAYYQKYTNLLNESILRTSGEKDALVGAPIDGVKPTDPVKVYLWYLGPAFFLFGLTRGTVVKLPNGFG